MQNWKTKVLKNYLFRNHMLYEAETLQKYSSCKPEPISCLYEKQHCSLVAMATWSFHTLIKKLKNGIYSAKTSQIFSQFFYGNVP